MSKQARFKTLGPNGWAPVVNPRTGEIMHVRYAENLGGSIVEIRSGQRRIADAYADKGFKFLADYYAADDDPELRARGLEVYLEYQAAIDRNQAERVTRDGNGRSTFKACPAEWLPGAVLAMQAGENAGTYKAPSRAKPDAPKAKAKAKSGAKA